VSGQQSNDQLWQSLRLSHIRGRKRHRQIDIFCSSGVGTLRIEGDGKRTDRGRYQKLREWNATGARKEEKYEISLGSRISSTSKKGEGTRVRAPLETRARRAEKKQTRKEEQRAKYGDKLGRDKMFYHRRWGERSQLPQGESIGIINQGCECSNLKERGCGSEPKVATSP